MQLATFNDKKYLIINEDNEMYIYLVDDIINSIHDYCIDLMRSQQKNEDYIEHWAVEDFEVEEGSEETLREPAYAPDICINKIHDIEFLIKNEEFYNLLGDIDVTEYARYTFY